MERITNNLRAAGLIYRGCLEVVFQPGSGDGRASAFFIWRAHRHCWTAPKAKRRGPQIAPRAPQKALSAFFDEIQIYVCLYLTWRDASNKGFWLPCVQWSSASSVSLRILAAGRKCFSSDCTVIIPQQTWEYHNSILGLPASANFPPAKPVRAKQNPTTQCIIPGSWGSLPTWHATLLTGGSSASEHMPLFYGDHERH